MNNIPNPKDLEGYIDLFENKLKQYTGNGDGRQVEAAVKSLGEQIEFDLGSKDMRLNMMIFNLEEPYYKNLDGWSHFREAMIYNRRFGVWIFESGTFENLGIGSYENWRFGGFKGGNWTRSGEPVKLFRKAYWPFSRHTGDGRLITFDKIY